MAYLLLDIVEYYVALLINDPVPKIGIQLLAKCRYGTFDKLSQSLANIQENCTLQFAEQSFKESFGRQCTAAAQLMLPMMLPTSLQIERIKLAIISLGLSQIEQLVMVQEEKDIRIYQPTQDAVFRELREHDQC